MLNYRFFFLGLIGILATFASHASVTILEPSDSDGFAEIQVQLSPPKFSRSAASTPITLELENPSGYPAVLYRPGFPELPVLRFFVQGEVQVSSTGATLIHTLSKTETLKVSQPPAPKVPNKMQATELAPEFLNSDEIWPKEAYSLEKAGFVNGVERKLLTIYPVSIEPKTQKLFFRESFKIHATRVNAQLGESRERESLPELFTFVVGERFLKSTALRDYEQSKREQGYEVREIQLATTSSSPEMIREQLQTLYRDPGYRMRYVLLIGDYEDVPSYQSNISDNVTDHYYACLDGPDYASDVSAPDVSVGRISARDENDLKSIFQKQTTYQRGHFSGEDWLRHPSFLATNDQWQIAEGTHNYVLDSYLKGGQYFGDFPTSHNLGGDQIFAVTHKAGAQDVLHALRTGSFFVDYSGHGSVTFWQNPQLLQPDIRSFSHRDARPFVIGNACITADFRTPESFAETWQRHSAGAIAYWGSTVLTYWGEDDILERSFADGVWKQGLTTFGETTDYAKQRLWLHYGGAELAAYYQEAYHLFGDPSLMFRFAPTEAVEITGPAVVPVGVPEVGFDLRTLSGKPVVGARVALVQKDFAQTVSGQTDVHGHVTLNLTNLDQHPGVWNRVIDPTNSALISDEFRFGQSPTPYLILDDLKVSGREGSALFAGENAALSLSVKNMGEQSAKVSTVSIESLEGPVTLLSSKTQLPTLGAGEGYSMPIGALSFEVSQNAQDGEKISAVLRWQTADGYTGLKRVNWVVERAQLEVVRVDAGDGIAIGKTGPVWLSFKNTGHEPMRDLVLEAVGGECVESISGPTRFDNVLPGQIVGVTQALQLGISNQCQAGDTASFKLKGSYQSIATASRVDVEATVSLAAGRSSVQIFDFAQLNLTIPDNYPGELMFAIPVSNVGKVIDLSIEVAIQHAFVGDLELSLVHPDGTTALFLNRRWSDKPDIRETFGMNGTLAKPLLTLQNKPTSGTWKLRIRDLARPDTGVLKRVKLSIQGYFE